MTLRLKGKKIGMTHVFDESGRLVVCTVIKVEPNVVVQLKDEKDGYKSVQLASDKIVTKDERTVEKRVKKPILGHYKKANVQPHMSLHESRLDDVSDIKVGQEFGAAYFKDMKFVDVMGTSIGKGFQGAMKLHNFSGMKASHGTGPVHRSLGSTGNRSTPGRCFPGGKRASHMGARRVTQQSLKVVSVNEEEQVVFVKGAIPGPRNGAVTLSSAVKK